LTVVDFQLHFYLAVADVREAFFVAVVLESVVVVVPEAFVAAVVLDLVFAAAFALVEVVVVVASVGLVVVGSVVVELVIEWVLDFEVYVGFVGSAVCGFAEN
jgi:hypothetical protein